MKVFRDEGDSLSLPRHQVEFVWLVSEIKDDNEYWVTFELRDFDHNYLRSIPVPKSFIINMIKQMEMREQSGKTYKKFEDATYQQGDLKE